MFSGRYGVYAVREALQRLMLAKFDWKIMYNNNECLYCYGWALNMYKYFDIAHNTFSVRFLSSER